MPQMIAASAWFLVFLIGADAVRSFVEQEIRSYVPYRISVYSYVVATSATYFLVWLIAGMLFASRIRGGRARLLAALLLGVTGSIIHGLLDDWVPLVYEVHGGAPISEEVLRWGQYFLPMIACGVGALAVSVWLIWATRITGVPADRYAAAELVR